MNGTNNAELGAVKNLVVLPGLNGTEDMLRCFVDATPQGWQTHLLPYRCDEVMDYEQLQQWLLPQIPEGECYLLGESFGGPLSIMLAHDLGARVRGHVLVASFLTSPVWKPLRLGPLNTFFRIRPTRLMTRWKLAGFDSAPELVAMLRDAVAGVEAKVIAERVRSLIKVDVREQYAALPCPTLYLQANQDKLIPARCADEVCVIKKDTVKHGINSSHLLLQREPQRAWALMDQFSGSATDLISPVVA